MIRNMVANMPLQPTGAFGPQLNGRNVRQHVFVAELDKAWGVCH